MSSHAAAAVVQHWDSAGTQLAQGFYYALVVLGGMVLLPLVLLTLALSKGATPDSSLINFLLGFVFTAIGQALLSSVAGIVGVLRLFLTLPGRKAQSRSLNSTLAKVAMATAPPVVGVTFFVIQTSIVSRLGGPEILSRSLLVCTFSPAAPSLLLASADGAGVEHCVPRTAPGSQSWSELSYLKYSAGLVRCAETGLQVSCKPVSLGRYALKRSLSRSRRSGQRNLYVQCLSQRSLSLVQPSAYATSGFEAASV
ncbi:hypothetical protein EXIGLDRAFT_698524 [Exidia glandulosa HHB12029]|uniref:Uncharacterized protein n=1 Tax=Exidia glandulosa HHB12029 TaxID=1314781 RepID=A0A165E892_EXIGL|nr:hypothetical protein EXIGLDRAFT_698524 [Exidia glandulosa HHB12029]